MRRKWARSTAPALMLKAYCQMKLLSQWSVGMDVKTYFFHNCIYSNLYKTPECENGEWIETEWMFRNLDSDYKVIIVGDAAMAPE